MFQEMPVVEDVDSEVLTCSVSVLNPGQRGPVRWRVGARFAESRVCHSRLNQTSRVTPIFFYSLRALEMVRHGEALPHIQRYRVVTAVHSVSAQPLFTPIPGLVLPARLQGVLAYYEILLHSRLQLLARTQRPHSTSQSRQIAALRGPRTILMFCAPVARSLMISCFRG